jgi:dUTP pyrophosphatase
MEELELKIKYHALIEKLSMIERGDWCDLRSAETVQIKAFESKRISLGISIELPEGYEAHIAPRSSTFSKWGIILTNSLGIVDESYKGDGDIWRAEFFATKDTAINFNDRVLQFRVVEKQPRLSFKEVESLDNEDRGGFGSTGIK